MIVNLHYKSLVFTIKTKSQAITVQRLKLIFREGLQKNISTFEKKIGQSLMESIKLLLGESVTYKLYSTKQVNLEEWKDEVLLKDLNFQKESDKSNKGLVLDFNVVAVSNIKKNVDSQEIKNIEELIAKATGATCELKSPVKKANSEEAGGDLNDMMLLSTILNLRNSGNDNSSRRELLTRIISSIGGGERNNSLSLINASDTSHNLLSLRMPMRLPNIEPNQDLINQLIEMGFPENRARRSLIMTRNNIEAAVELIANDQDLDSSQPSSQIQSSLNIIDMNQSQELDEDENN